MKERAELTEELDTAKSMTQGAEADRTAQRYYRETRNAIVKLFTPNPDKDNTTPRPGLIPVMPGWVPMCVGCENRQMPGCIGCEKPKPLMTPGEQNQ
jgi:hypothetical protein